MNAIAQIRLTPEPRRDDRDAPDRLDDQALFALCLGGRPRARKAAALALEARGLETWARLPVLACLAETRRLLEPADALRATALMEFARRALGPPPGVELSRPEDVAALLVEWRHATREHFIAFHLNARNQLLRRELVSIGSLSASLVHPREVFAPAVEGRAAGLIVAHNHPSGDPEPSPEDLAISRRLADAGALLGIELLDHVVVAARGFVSIKSRGGL